MTKLQQIVKKAKEIRKASPNKYPKWTDYIKAASKSLAGLDSVKRSGNKTTVNYTRHTSAKKTATKKVTQAKLFGIKKAAPKRKPATHKDTKSHNVKIKVISGVNSFAINQLKQITSEITKREAAIKHMQPLTKYIVSDRANVKKNIKANRDAVTNLKKQITLIKKSIK